MPRPIKTGFDYFPLDSDIFQDIKIKRLVRDCGAEAITVYIKLLCVIFKQGYFINYDDDLYFFFSDELKLKEDYIESVFNRMIEHKLLDKNLFEKNIITSKGIQKRYTQICISSKRTTNISEYNLVSSEETNIITEETDINSELSTQSKVKESKLKESKEDILPETFQADLKPEIDSSTTQKEERKKVALKKETDNNEELEIAKIFNFPKNHILYSKEVENRFNNYLFIRHSFPKKPICNQVIYESLLRTLSTLTDNKETALRIIDQSINGSYPDFYEIKKNGTTTITGKNQDRFNAGKQDYSKTSF